MITIIRNMKLSLVYSKNFAFLLKSGYKALLLLLSSLRVALIEFSSTKIIVITLANHKELKQCSEPIKKSR